MGSNDCDLCEAVLTDRGTGTAKTGCRPRDTGGSIELGAGRTRNRIHDHTAANFCLQINEQMPVMCSLRKDFSLSFFRTWSRSKKKFCK